MRRVILVLGLCGASAVACGGSSPRAVSAVAGLPEYTPDETALLGDTMTAPVFGLPAEIPPANDPKLPERVARAETVVRVRVATLTEETLAGVKGSVLTVVQDEPPLAGAPQPGPMDLHLGAGNAALGRVHAMGQSIMGRRFLLFVRRYADQGEPTLHFHAEADVPEVRKAIDSAMTLGQKKTPASEPKKKK